MKKLIFRSIPLKISLSILLIEAVFLTGFGFFYTNKFNQEIDKAVVHKLLQPAVLMSERALNYSAATDLAVMSEIVQEDVVDCFISKADGTIFYTYDPTLEGKMNSVVFENELPSFQGKVQSTVKTSSFTSSSGIHYIATLSPLLRQEKVLGTLYIRINASSIVQRKDAVLHLFLYGAVLTILCTTLFEAFWVYWLIVPRIRRTSTVLHTAENYDLTVRIKDYGADDQLGVLMRQVDVMIEKIQNQVNQLLHSEKLAAIGGLSASFAHEFNNPLQGVMSVIDGVKQKIAMDTEDAELVDMAIGECNRMKDLIKSLQDFNRPSSGNIKPVDIHATIDSLLLLSRKEYYVKNIVIETHYAKDMVRIEAVDDQIKQVVLNLLNNSAYACEGGGTITIITEVVGEDNIVIIIRDSGKGIEPEHINKIFEPFFTTKPAIKGTGLGLSVSYGIIKKHGGRIEVASEPGRGTTFTVTLPVDGVGVIAGEKLQ